MDFKSKEEYYAYLQGVEETKLEILHTEGERAAADVEREIELEKQKQDYPLPVQLKDQCPYPEDIYTPPTEEEMKMAVSALEDAGLVPERIFSEWGRRVWKNACDILEMLIEG